VRWPGIPCRAFTAGRAVSPLRPGPAAAGPAPRAVPPDRAARAAPWGGRRSSVERPGPRRRNAGGAGSAAARQRPGACDYAMRSGCCVTTATMPARWTAACPNGATGACPSSPHDHTRRPSPAAGLSYGTAISSLTFPARLPRAVNVRDEWRRQEMSKPAHRTRIRWQLADGHRITLKVTSGRIDPWEIADARTGYAGDSGPSLDR
jgi:hypothetical protein